MSKVPQSAKKALHGVWAWLDLRTQVGKAIGATIALALVGAISGVALYLYSARPIAFLSRGVTLSRWAAALAGISIPIAYGAGLMTPRFAEWRKKKNIPAEDIYPTSFPVRYPTPGGGSVPHLSINWSVRWEAGEVAEVAPYCGHCGIGQIQESNFVSGYPPMNLLRIECLRCSIFGVMPGSAFGLEKNVQGLLLQHSYAAKNREASRVKRAATQKGR